MLTFSAQGRICLAAVSFLLLFFEPATRTWEANCNAGCCVPVALLPFFFPLHALSFKTFWLPRVCVCVCLRGA
ncbi:hypothetical protein TRSC58_07692 [Trypanosoma rangeli SC58]|uniref:Secreted protein n=1 Tax=Trypanosoma rangeli SC58 TaxID=429131 RepID=A0A061IUN5_TRYRA|nr:hypothetical protein TRSC58_07692 [Trypanosoma rangeli SC58]